MLWDDAVLPNCDFYRPMGDKTIQKTAEDFFPTVLKIWNLAFLVLHLLIDTWQLACASFLELLSWQRDWTISAKSISEKSLITRLWTEHANLASFYFSAFSHKETARRLQPVGIEVVDVLLVEWEHFSWWSSLIEQELLLGGWSFSWKPVKLKFQHLLCKRCCVRGCPFWIGLVLVR